MRLEQVDDGRCADNGEVGAFSAFIGPAASRALQASSGVGC